VSKQNKVLGPFVGGLGVRCDVVARAATKKGVPRVCALWRAVGLLTLHIL